jgi:glutathione S-transferase
MYTLYWERLSGVIAPEAMLREMDIPYERICVDMAAGEHLEEHYLAINPTGQVPAMRYPNGQVIGESAAMVLSLGERHPDSGLVPLPQEPDRPQFLYWLLYMAATGYPTAGRVGHPERYTTDQNVISSVLSAADAQNDRFFGILNSAIGGNPYFLPRGFSALDIYLTMLALWHSDTRKLDEQNPKIAVLRHAVFDRPSFRNVMIEHDVLDAESASN